MSAKGYVKKGTVRATVSPTLRDLSWAAGFIEGEGSFQRTKTGEVISVYQVQKGPVEKLLSLFGGSLTRRIDRVTDQHNPVWVWRACGMRARGILMTLYPLMFEKRQQQIRETLGANVSSAPAKAA